MNLKAKITGVGGYVPSEIRTNEYLTTVTTTSDMQLYSGCYLEQFLEFLLHLYCLSYSSTYKKN